MTRLGGAIALGVLALLVALFLGVLVSHRDPSEVPSALIGEQLRDFSLPPIPGRTKEVPADGLALADLTQGQVTIVNVFASWCAPCRFEHPHLKALTAAGFTLDGINYKDPEDAALAFLKEGGDPYNRIGRDGRGRVAIDWGIYGVPETFVVDGAGRVVLRHAGPLDADIIAKEILPAARRAAAAEEAPAPASASTGTSSLAVPAPAPSN